MIAARVFFESIVFTCPLMGVAGLLVGVVACRLQSRAVLTHGLSAPLICAFGAMLIAVNHWGPDSAQEPIMMMLAGYTILSLPLAAVSLHRVSRLSRRDAVNNERPWWQFSLRSMLVTVTTVCVSIAVARLLFRYVPRADSIAFGDYAIAYAALSAYVGWRYRVFAHVQVESR